MSESEGKPAAPAATDEKGEREQAGGSMLPTVLAGAGILVVAGLMIFWPQDATERTATGESSAAAAKAAGAGGRGGVAARQADEAKQGPSADERIKPRVNPRLQVATEFGMSPNPPPSGPPEFKTHDEELKYWELQLSEAKRVLAMREKAIERLPKIKEQLMAGSDPEAGLKAFERREQVVLENLEKQRQLVAELEEKVGALREKSGG
jgi:hypothetical protein